MPDLPPVSRGWPEHPRVLPHCSEIPKWQMPFESSLRLGTLIVGTYLFCCPVFIWPGTFLESQWKQNTEKGTSALVLQNGKLAQTRVRCSQWDRNTRPPTAETSAGASDEKRRGSSEHHLPWILVTKSTVVLCSISRVLSSGFKFKALVESFFMKKL